MTAEQFVNVLGWVESGDDPEAWGDSGQAMGRFQVHPSWLMQRASNFAVKPLVDDTWDSFVARVVAAFFVAWSKTLTPVEVAMFFHLGHPVRVGEGDWDSNYAVRFASYAVNVG